MIKNLFFTICAALCICCTVQDVEAQVWDNGDAMLHAGVGIGGYTYSGATSLPAIGISYDKALKNDLGPGHLSIGGIVGFKTASNNDFDTRWTNIFVGGRALYHWDRINSDKWDVYGGVVLGIRYYKYKYDYLGANSSSSSVNLLIGGLIGAQYFFTNNIGAYVEIGNSIGYLNAGVTIKM